MSFSIVNFLISGEMRSMCAQTAIAFCIVDCLNALNTLNGQQHQVPYPFLQLFLVSFRSQAFISYYRKISDINCIYVCTLYRAAAAYYHEFEALQTILSKTINGIYIVKKTLEIKLQKILCSANCTIETQISITLHTVHTHTHTD